MKLEYRRSLCRLPMLFGLMLFPAILFAQEKRVDGIPSRAGTYEGVMVQHPDSIKKHGAIPTQNCQVVADFKLESQDIYVVEGGLFDVKSSPPIAVSRLQGRFDAKKNQFVFLQMMRGKDIAPGQVAQVQGAGFLDRPSDYTGGFVPGPDGNEVVVANTVSRNVMRMVLWRKREPPPRGGARLIIKSADIEPAEVMLGKPVVLKGEFKATSLIDPQSGFEEEITVTAPSGKSIVSNGKCSLYDLQVGPEGVADGLGKINERPITAAETGTHTCRVRIKGPGYSEAAEKTVTFNVKQDPAAPASTPSAAPGAVSTAPPGGTTIPAGTPVWFLKKIDIDPDKIAENDLKAPERVRWNFSISPNSASGTIQAPLGNSNVGAHLKVKAQFGGAVPSVLRPGDKFDATVSMTASPKDHIAGSAGMGARIDVRGGLRKTRTPPDVEEGVGECREGFVASRQITYHIEVPADLTPDDSRELTVYRVLSGRGCVAICHYVADVATNNTVVADVGGETAGGAAAGGAPAAGGALAIGAPVPRRGLEVWLDSPSITLVPGEPSQINGIWVRGWRKNTADRVEVDLAVVDNWGSLAINRNIVAAPGSTSAEPASMDGDEYRFSEMWSVRLGALTRSETVPIVVRQQGGGIGVALLRVNIIPRYAGVFGEDGQGGAVQPAVPGGNAGGAGTLKAWMDEPSIDLVPGEPGKINGVWVEGWRNNTADRVEVTMDVVDNWGSQAVNPGIVAAPGITSADPGGMFGEKYRFPQIWSARIGARQGVFNVPVTVRQKGTGTTTIIMTVRVLSNPGLQQQAGGSSSGAAAGGGVPVLPGKPGIIAGGAKPGAISGDGKPGVADDVHGQVGGAAETATAIEVHAARRREEQAVQAMVAGDFAAAEQAYRDVARLTPDAVSAWLNLGHVCLELNKSDNAAEAGRKVLRLAGDDAKLHAEAAQLLHAAGRSEEARQAARRAMELGLGKDSATQFSVFADLGLE